MHNLNTLADTPKMRPHQGGAAWIIPLLFILSPLWGAVS